MEVGDDFNIKVIFSTLMGVKGTQRDPEAFLVQVYRESHSCFLGEKNVHCFGLEIVLYFYCF